MSREIPITELAKVIRSKNAGPFELTFDIIFKDRESYELAKRSKVFSRELFAKLYQIPLEQVLHYTEFDAANAIKATIVKPTDSGSVGETDVYGAQQHAPMLGIKVPC